jgi:hypothetical protein
MKYIPKLAAGVAGCGTEALAYGACVNQAFAGVQRDACAPEFLRFKACLAKVLTKRKA